MLISSSAYAASTLSDSASAFLWAIAGILLGGAFTYLAVRVQVKDNYKTVQRNRLLRLRTDSFRRLWQITGAIQRSPDESILSNFPFEAVTSRLDTWYFEDGGIYLTDACRERYFELLEELRKAKTRTPLDMVSYQPLYGAASKLRAMLSIEIDTRSSAVPRAI